MKKIKLSNGATFDLMNAVESIEIAEGKNRHVMCLEFPEGYSVEQVQAAFGNESRTTELTMGEENEEGIQWYTPTHKYYNLLLSCGYESVQTGIDADTEAPIFERKLLAKLGKRTPEEIEIYDLRRNMANLEAAVVELAFGGGEQ